MKAVVCHETNLEVAEVPDPVPGPGQVHGIGGFEDAQDGHGGELGVQAGDFKRPGALPARPGRAAPPSSPCR